MSPLDVRVMAPFDIVEGKHHQCAIDDFYNSATFFKSAYNHEKKVLTRGVISKVMICIPPFIKQ